MKEKCILLEGGGLRCSFTAGVMDFLLEHKYNFDRIIGVSAGACAGASYASRQLWRNYAVNVVYPSHSRYMGMWNLITKLSYFNMQFVFDEIPSKIYYFDTDALLKNPAKLDIAVTSLENGELVILGKKEIKEYGILPSLQASSSIPLMSRPVVMGGKKYYDGGVADSIPIQYALSKHKKVFVVLTQPRGYRKKMPKFPWITRLLLIKHPVFAKTLINRNKFYNDTLDLCDKLEAEGKIFILSPPAELKIKRLEKDIVVRDKAYRYGYALMKKEFNNLKKFLGK